MMNIMLLYSLTYFFRETYKEVKIAIKYGKDEPSLETVISD